MESKSYEYLLEIYPEYISLDQLYRICGIAKRSARYLVEHGIIPANDTGKNTWRYKIAIADVIIYLQRRDTEGSLIPRGQVSSRAGTRIIPASKSHSGLIKSEKEITCEKDAESFDATENQADTKVSEDVPNRTIPRNNDSVIKARIVESFTRLCVEYSDVLTSSDIAKITGLDRKTVTKHISAGNLQALRYSTGYIIPKEYFMAFVQTDDFINSICKSEKLLSVLNNPQ